MVTNLQKTFSFHCQLKCVQKCSVPLICWLEMEMSYVNHIQSHYAMESWNSAQKLGLTSRMYCISSSLVNVLS